MTAIANRPDLFSGGAVTVGDLKTRYRISKSVAYVWMSSGRLPYSTTTGRRLIPVKAIEALLAEGLVGAEMADAK